MHRRLLTRLALLLVWPLVAVSSGAAGEAETLILARADADASGGLPVLLWVRDGERSSVTVRAAREQLGDVPGRMWWPAPARDLLHLERLGAPRLEQTEDTSPCPTALWWAVPQLLPRPDYKPPERDALQHEACGVRNCAQEAWRLALPEAAAELPLARLLPGLAAQGEAWLVLYVVGPDPALALEGLPTLRMPQQLGFDLARYPPQRALPAAAAARFPEIHTAMLAHAAAQQNLTGVSTVMRSEGVGVQPLKFARFRFSNEAQLQALGLTDSALGWHYLVRLLLRLHPASRPETLRPVAVSETAANRPLPMHALVPQPASAESCRASIDQLLCEAACRQRVSEFRQSPQRRFHVAPELSASDDPAVLQQACVPACERQKEQLRDQLGTRFDAAEQRQQQAWRLIEELTARPPASWQSR